MTLVTARTKTLLTALMVCALLGAFVMAAGATPDVDAPPPPIPVPDEFTPAAAAPGVHVYHRHGDDGAFEYIQIVDLSAGARLAFLHGPIADPGAGRGIYGGNSPSIRRQFLSAIWNALPHGDSEAAEASVLCLTNGQFFLNTRRGAWVDPTELAFPVKSDGVILSEGYERWKFRAQKVMLEIWPGGWATISPFSGFALYRSAAPDIMVGLSERARVRSFEELGRTYVGVADGDQDGLGEILLLYSATAATQETAVDTLRTFGAREIMMLDGGGSTQLLCQGQSFIFRARPLPQTIATIPADPEPLPAPTVHPADIPHQIR
ncbi:MAG: hypothetical protein R3248_08055 [Candidatus Promineifilaceae bacterium]|nr:hypothetical protein [Candidatus Promineifilaceae bacterium]